MKCFIVQTDGKKKGDLKQIGKTKSSGWTGNKSVEPITFCADDNFDNYEKV